MLWTLLTDVDKILHNKIDKITPILKKLSSPKFNNSSNQDPSKSLYINAMLEELSFFKKGKFMAYFSTEN